MQCFRKGNNFRRGKLGAGCILFFLHFVSVFVVKYIFKLTIQVKKIQSILAYLCYIMNI